MDYGATPFRLFHSWFSWDGFDKLVSVSWNGMQLEDRNDMFRFKRKFQGRSHINFTFSNRLSREQTYDLEKHVSTDEIRKAVWDCGENKSPGPDGYTFEFFRKFWSLVGPDFCKAIQWQILDGPFIINELLSWCKRKKKHAMLFKVYFAKAYDLVRWDFLDDVLCSFGFGDPLVPYLFILVMESLHFSFSRVIEAGMFKGILIDNSVMISHLFYADDTVFVAASKLGCSILKTPFKYLGVIVGSSMSRDRAWEDTLCKIKSHLSKWKTKTLSIGGRLTLLKAVLGATPIYAMSLYKVPKTVLNVMESIRSKLFNGIDSGNKKITWIKWIKVLAAKKNGGLGVSSFYALNMALLFRRVWRFISQGDSLWFRLVRAIHGNNINRIQEFDATRWIKCIPIKVNVFAWKVRHDRLATKSNLILRGISLDSPTCPMGMSLVKFRLAAGQLVYGMVIVAEVNSNGS
nr:RNA-directed DNA polymerase, eukaryota [Tanacetum cinerariifolium]